MPLYLLRQLSVMTMLRGQSTCGALTQHTWRATPAQPSHTSSSADLVPELQAAQHIRSVGDEGLRQELEGEGEVGGEWGVPMQAVLQRLAQHRIEHQRVEELPGRLPCAQLQERRQVPRPSSSRCRPAPPPTAPHRAWPGPPSQRASRSGTARTPRPPSAGSAAAPRSAPLAAAPRRSSPPRPCSPGTRWGGVGSGRRAGQVEEAGQGGGRAGRALTGRPAVQ